MNSKNKRYERDLYEPIEQYFQELGYVVHGEVHHCDITAVKEEELVIIELKLSLTVDLLIQASNRKRMTDLVYVAIPKPKVKMKSKKWHELCLLLKRLEVGLITVQFIDSKAKVEVIFPPEPFNQKKSQAYYKKHRKRLLAEIEGRSVSRNIGGSTKMKIMTAYKESCIHIASLLLEHGPLKPKQLREYGTGDKTLSILHKNYYKWFEKVGHGTYQISQQGKAEIQEHEEIIHYYQQVRKTEKHE